MNITTPSSLTTSASVTTLLKKIFETEIVIKGDIQDLQNMIAQEQDAQLLEELHNMKKMLHESQALLVAGRYYGSRILNPGRLNVARLGNE